MFPGTISLKYSPQRVPRRIASVDTLVISMVNLCIASHSAADGDIKTLRLYHGMKSYLSFESKKRLCNECCDVLYKHVSAQSLGMHKVYVGDHLKSPSTPDYCPVMLVLALENLQNHFIFMCCFSFHGLVVQREECIVTLLLH